APSLGGAGAVHSAVMAAGPDAADASCAVAGPGTGELFTRAVVAHDVAARMLYGGQPLAEAARAVVMDTLPRLGGAGSGGLIAVDARGGLVMPFNSEGMYRGCAVAGGARTVGVFRD